MSWLILERLRDLDKRFDQLETVIGKRLDAIDKRLDGHDADLRDIRHSIDGVRNWIIIIAIPSFGLMAGILVKLLG